jgi:threonine/homoserine/homoserine lactone efflux protein
VSEDLALLGILAALAVGTVSPGPSFVMVARTAAAQSRRDGVAAALGMGVGGLLFALLALLGLVAVLAGVPALYMVLKVAGGLYLAWLGFQIWRGARQPLDVSAAPAPGGRAFLLGLATQISNPKTALVYASVFAAFLPPHYGVAFAVALITLVFLLEAGWYTIVALALSAERPRAAYLHGKAWIDRTAGAVLVALGLKLALDAHRS